MKEYRVVSDGKGVTRTTNGITRESFDQDEALYVARMFKAQNPDKTVTLVERPFHTDQAFRRYSGEEA